MQPRPLNGPGYRGDIGIDNSTIVFDSNGLISMAGVAAGADNSSLEESGSPLKMRTKAGGVLKTHLAGGFLKRVLADGTASATDVTVAGMAVGDELVSVISYTTKASIASQADRTSEYVVGAGKLTKAGGTNETNNQLSIMYLDLT